jgi:homoserine kinase
VGASARERATAYAPGSTSNLGPGFDCLGIAFTGRGDRVTAIVSLGEERADQRAARETPPFKSARGAGPGAAVAVGARRATGVRVVSVSDPRVPKDPARNTAAIAAAAVLRRAGASVSLDLEIEKGLPLSGGMGGSAASAVAGAVAADAVLGAGLSKDDLLAAALEAETVVAGRHYDNVAPSLHGGAVLVVGTEPPRIVPVIVAGDLALVLATPSYGVETAKARAVLPRDIPRDDAIAQASSLAGLLLGLERGDHDLIRRSLRDRIAEPARASLYPGAAEARAAAVAAGALGVVVSGAGPTLVALAPPAASAAVAQALVEGYRKAKLEAVAHEAGVDAEGARIVSRG